MRGGKWKEVTQTVRQGRQKRQQPWDNGGIHEADRQWRMRRRGDGDIHRVDWWEYTGSDPGSHSVWRRTASCQSYFKPPVESQRSAQVWSRPANVGQRRRDAVTQLMEESLGMLLETEFILSAGPLPLGHDWNMSKSWLYTVCSHKARCILNKGNGKSVLWGIKNMFFFMTTNRVIKKPHRIIINISSSHNVII